MTTQIFLTVLVAILFPLLFLIERFAPLRRATVSLGPRIVVNLVMSALAFAAAALLVKPAAMAMLGLNAEQAWGIVPVLGLPWWAGSAVAFILMDLSFYYWHLLNHRIGFLWRFHNVHHIDPDLDVTTAFRFHFGEIALSAVFRVSQVALIGVSLPVYLFYEFCLQANTAFHHSNIRLPIRFERLLNRILVTPRMHGIHHSEVRGEMNSNYGVVFPWWDRLHGTIRLNIAQAALVIGVPGYSRPEDHGLLRALILPFMKQKNYWTRPDGSEPERFDDAVEQDRGRLSE